MDSREITIRYIKIYGSHLVDFEYLNILQKNLLIELIEKSFELNRIKNIHISKKRVITLNEKQLKHFLADNNILVNSSKSRKADNVYARKLFSYFANTYTKLSFEEIGKCIGRNRTQIYHLITSVNNLIETSTKDREHILFLNSELIKKFNKTTYICNAVR